MASSRFKDVLEDEITSLQKDPRIVLAEYKWGIILSRFCYISFFELDGCTTFNRFHFVLIDELILSTNLFSHHEQKTAPSGSCMKINRGYPFFWPS